MKRCLLLLLALVMHASAWAHKPSDSYLTLRATAGSDDVAVRWDIALRDLDYVLELDRDGNGALTWGEVRQRADDITRYATTHLALTAADKACRWETAGPMMLDKHSDGTYAVLSLAAKCENLRKGPESALLAAVRRGPFPPRPGAMDRTGRHRLAGAGVRHRVGRADAPGQGAQRLGDIAAVRGRGHVAHLDRLRPHPLPVVAAAAGGAGAAGRPLGPGRPA